MQNEFLIVTLCIMGVSLCIMRHFAHGPQHTYVTAAAESSLNPIVVLVVAVAGTMAESFDVPTNNLLVSFKAQVTKWGEDVPPGLSWRSDPVRTLSDLTLLVEAAHN